MSTVPSDSMKCLALLPVSTISLLSVTVRVPKIILSGLFPASPNSPFNSLFQFEYEILIASHGSWSCQSNTETCSLALTLMAIRLDFMC